MKRIGVITSGGDAPGMNAAIRSVVRTAVGWGIEVVGIYRGFQGLLDDQFTNLNSRSVSGIINRGGTILKTVRSPEMKTAGGMKRAVAALRRLSVEGLIVIGGDGSLHAGHAIGRRGIPAVCIPASIDNDIYGTDETIGFDTALTTAVEAIDKIRDTATSHERIFVVEVMGREHGFLSLSVGLAAGAEFVLIPEIPADPARLCRELKAVRRSGKSSIVIVFAEGAGNPYDLAAQITKCTGHEVRVSSLGYIQRGGSPTPRSRILACQFGARAVEIMAKGIGNRVVVYDQGTITDIPISVATVKEKKLDMRMYRLAQQLAT